MQNDPYGKTPNKQLLWVAGAGVLFVVGLFAFGAGSGWFGLLGGKNSGLQKPGEGPAPALAKPADAVPSLPKVENPVASLPRQQVRMPKDVYDWLKHLEETERRRRSLALAGVGTLTVQLAYLQLGAPKNVLEGLLNGDPEALENTDPAKQTSLNSDKMRGQWRDLNAFFKSVPPPQECVGAFSSYSEALGETSAMILEVLDAITKAQENPEAAISALNALKGDSSPRIGRPALETDREVQVICDRYETRKWFSIAADFGQGSLGQAGGLPNMGSSP